MPFLSKILTVFTEVQLDLNDFLSISSTLSVFHHFSLLFMEVLCRSCQIPVSSPIQSQFCDKCLLNNTSDSKLASIDRTPIKCPVTKCGHRMCITSLLSHFITEECVLIDFMSISEKNPEIELSFNPLSLPRDETYCIGGLLYGNEEKGLSLPNSIHNIRYEQYKNHLPILIMAAKSGLRVLLTKKEPEPESGTDESLLFWLVSPQTSRPVFVELFAHNGMCGKGTTVSVKDVRQKESLSEFLQETSNYLYLTPGEMLNLRNEDETIRLKIKILVSPK